MSIFDTEKTASYRNRNGPTITIGCAVIICNHSIDEAVNLRIDCYEQWLFHFIKHLLVWYPEKMTCVSLISAKFFSRN